MKEQDVPQEVWWVWALRNCGCYGLGDIEKMESIIRRYPKYFPWETKYNSIPQKIHDAYRKEKNAWFDELYKETHGEDYIGIIPTIMKMGEVQEGKPLEPPKSISEILQEAFQKQEYERKQQNAEYAKNKAIWDKHYKPYGLEYRK